MFEQKLQDFLDRNEACSDGIERLQSVGVETLEQAWDKASDEDLVWAVTRPGVMNPEQRRQFLVMILSSIEDKLTDPRSKNILTKLRSNEPITDEDRAAAWAATAAAAWAAEAATWEATWATAREAMAARATKAQWIRENFKLCNLHTN